MGKCSYAEGVREAQLRTMEEEKHPAGKQHEIGLAGLAGAVGAVRHDLGQLRGLDNRRGGGRRRGSSQAKEFPAPLVLSLFYAFIK